MHLVQFLDQHSQRAVGIVENDRINVLKNIRTVYELFFDFPGEHSIESRASTLRSGTYENYDQLIFENRILIPVDHSDAYHLWVTGTGLTHLGSAASRNAMHENLKNSDSLTDSMRMFEMGLNDGKLLDSRPGIQPEWFYKGNGLTIVPSGSPISSPEFAMSGSEEPEIAGVYVVDRNGNPRRLGFVLGNEFSDHAMEKINYLYLAHSKLRTCSIGPEILLSALPESVTGESSILRNGKIIWQKEFLTGESNMSHNIANLEYHLFKYDLFRQPGDVHIHFFGTSALSFSDNIILVPGDVFSIEADCFTRPLQNIYDSK